jgi:hypothetical protein
MDTTGPSLNLARVSRYAVPTGGELLTYYGIERNWLECSAVGRRSVCH